MLNNWESPYRSWNVGLGTPTPLEPLKEWPKPHKNAEVKASEICRKAATLLEGERAEQHGDKFQLHAMMARVMSAYLQDIPLPMLPRHAAMLEAIIKMCRSANGNYNPDDFVDGAAYFAIAGELADVGC